VTGDTATAKVTQQFGPNAIGAAGTWTFARSGANWQVSEWGIDFLRSYVGTVFSPAYQSSDPTSDPIADASYRACVASALQVAPDASFRPIAYGLLSNRNTALGQLVVGCDAKAPGGTSPWWKVLENAISGTDKSALGIQISTCMMSGLHAKYSDGDIINVIMNENGTSGAKSVQDEMTTVGTKCGKQAVAGKLPTVKKGGHTTASPQP
jgi:hypothetical protein